MNGKRVTVYIDVSIMKLLLFLTGIQRVVREEILQLYDYDDIDLCFLAYDEKKQGYNILPPRKLLNSLRPGDYADKDLKNENSRRFVMPDEMESGSVFFDLDAAWMCRMKRSYLYPVLKKNGVKLIVHIYDIICITHPQFFEDMLVYKFMDYLGAALQHADKLICNAHATEDDIRKLTGELGIQCPDISVVPLGADFTDKEIDEDVIPSKIREAVRNRSILMVGTLEPRKNHKLLLDAYDNGLKEEGYNIIFAGTSGWRNEAFMERLTTHSDYDKRVFFFQKQPDSVINYLYKKTKYVAFLSYKEGYGLPIIEALAKGVPVIASDTPVNRETGKEKCVYFRQDDAEGLYNTIKNIDEEGYAKLRDNLKDYRYCSWKESAEQMRNILTKNN